MVGQVVWPGLMGIADLSNINAAVDYIKSFGSLAPVAAYILFTFQAAVPIIPYVILAGAAGLIFGFWPGFIIAWLGALSGACILFLLVRINKWNWLYVRINKRYKIDITSIKGWYGFWAIFLSRVLPVVPTPLINILSGISGISFWIFLIASALGKIPMAAIYTGLGNRLYVSGDLYGTLGILAAVIVVSYLGVRVVRKKGWI